MAEDKQEVLFYDNEAFINKQKQETEITESIYKLKQLYNKALGAKANVDYSRLTKDAVGYIVNEFWSVHCSNMPEHLNRYTIFFSQTSISEADIQSVFDTYKVSCNKMAHVHGKDALPKATKTDITFKENRYPKYLDETKKKQYEMLKRFVTIANKLQDTQGSIHLVRYCPDLTTNGFKIAINLHRFIL